MEYVYAILDSFTSMQLALTALAFIWSGFVRAGLGFGGAALALPFFLLIKGDPVFWLPVLGAHLLFFSTLTVMTRLRNVNWGYLNKTIWILLLPKISGVLGLLTLPTTVLVILVYTITLIYAITYIANYTLGSESKWRERLFLVMGGYLSGTSLLGAPLIVPVYAKHVARHQFRDTLFVLWIILVIIKMAGFVAFDVPLNWQFALLVAPFAGLGHLLGLKAHNALISGDERNFKRAVGVGLAAVSLIGLISALR